MQWSTVPKHSPSVQNKPFERAQSRCASVCVVNKRCFVCTSSAHLAFESLTSLWSCPWQTTVQVFACLALTFHVFFSESFLDTMWNIKQHKPSFSITMINIFLNGNNWIAIILLTCMFWSDWTLFRLFVFTLTWLLHYWRTCFYQRFLFAPVHFPFHLSTSLFLSLSDLQLDEVWQLHPLPQVAAVPGVHAGWGGG